jgi:hypothetical protein
MEPVNLFFSLSDLILESVFQLAEIKYYIYMTYTELKRYALPWLPWKD